MKCFIGVGFKFHVVFGSLAIIVTFVTVDPLALRLRFSPGLPLSNDKMDDDCSWKKTASPEIFQARRILFRSQIDDHRRPGHLSHCCDVRPVGFASPVFTRFAFFECFLLAIFYTVFFFFLFTFS